jgi:hypothetical protein
MRRTLTVLIVIRLLVLLFGTDLPARNNTDWSNVKKLKRGASVEILLWSGENLRGKIDEVRDAGVQLAMIDRSNPQLGLQYQFERTSIRRIATVRQLNLPDSRRWIVTGTLAGGGIGFVGGAIADVTHGTNYHWLTGSFGGAIAGLLVSCVALAAVGGVDMARARQREKVVYEDTRRTSQPAESNGAAPEAVLSPTTGSVPSQTAY